MQEMSESKLTMTATKIAEIEGTHSRGYGWWIDFYYVRDTDSYVVVTFDLHEGSRLDERIGRSDETIRTMLTNYAKGVVRLDYADAGLREWVCAPNKSPMPSGLKQQWRERAVRTELDLY
jgi:hypothetical protein